MTFVRNCMLDLETMGTASNAAIMSIGAVIFDMNVQGFIGTKFYQNVKLQSCLDAGLKLDGGTVEWWLSQSDSARKALISDAVDIQTACRRFATYLEFNAVEGLWGNGSTFDNVIIRNAFKAVGVKFPLHYRCDMDVRTLVRIANELGIKSEEKPMEGVAHNALDDAVRQVGYCTELYSKIRGLNGPKQA